MSIVQIQPGLKLLGAGRQAVAALGHQQGVPSAAVGVKQQHRTVVDWTGRQQHRRFEIGERSRRRAQLHANRAPGGSAQNHIVHPVSIHLPHRQSGTPAVEPGGQQPLLRGFVDGLLPRLQRQAGGPAHLGELAARRRARLGPQRRRWARRLGDRIMSVDRQVGELLGQSARPSHGQMLDDRIVPEPEMQDRFAAGKNAARQDQLAHLHARGALDPDGGADAKMVGDGPAKFNDHPVAGVAVIAENRDSLLKVGIHQIEVAVTIQVAKRRPEAHAPLVEPPSGADVFKLQVAQIAKGQLGLGQDRAVAHDPQPFRRGLRTHLPREEVDVGRLPVHAVGHEKVEPAVIVQVFKARPPRPVGGGEAGEIHGFEAATGSGVEEERTVLVLRRHLGIPVVLPGAAARIGHAALVLFMRGRGHVGDQEIDEPVIVHIAQIRAHRGVGRVRHHLVEDIGEGTVAVVVVELVGRCEIAAHVEVGPAVVVVIPPDSGVPLPFPEDSRPFGYIRKRAVAVVVKQVVLLAVRMRVGVQ